MQNRQGRFGAPRIVVVLPWPLSAEPIAPASGLGAVGDQVIRRLGSMLRFVAYCGPVSGRRRERHQSRTVYGFLQDSNRRAYCDPKYAVYPSTSICFVRPCWYQEPFRCCLAARRACKRKLGRS